MDIPHIQYTETRDPFYRALKARVDAYLAAPGRSRYAGPAMWMKTASLSLLYLIAASAVYSRWLHGPVLLVTVTSWQLIQFLMTIGVAHDAAHGCYSRNPRVNRRIMYFFDIHGINSRRWMQNHLHSHHAVPNVPLLDSAIESFALVRLHPLIRRSRIHRWQHWYMFGVYALVTLFQVYLLEFVSFAQGLVGFRQAHRGWGRELAWLFVNKLLVLVYTLVLPAALMKGQGWVMIGGWLLGHILSGLALGIIFQTTHLHQATSFIQPDAEGRVHSSLAMHILRTTAEFSVDNPLVTWLAGGLNLHVTHHLFPAVSQVHLPALSRIVRQTATEFGMPYQAYGLLDALISHLRTLRWLGTFSIENGPHGGSIPGATSSWVSASPSNTVSVL